MDKNLAKLILKAQEIREKSYNSNAAENSNIDCAFIDYSDFYMKTIEQSIFEASVELDFDHELDYPTCLLLLFGWNDIQLWAKTIAKQELKNNLKCVKRKDVINGN